jgi:vesicle transport protein SEC22
MHFSSSVRRQSGGLFVSFQPPLDNAIQRTKRSYQDIRAKQNLSRLQEELMDVSHIMTTNIKDVLERGNRLEKMSLMSDTLAAESKRFVRDARQLNLDALYRKYGTPAVLVVVVIFSLWVWIKFF